MPDTLPAWLAPFAPAFRDALLPLLAPSDPPRLACFDADGTLWAEDLGEAFFRWLIAGHLLPRVDCSRDVYAEYEARVREDRAAGYAWCVQCMAGIAETDLQRWSRQMAAAWPNYRPEMVSLARGLAASGVEVWMVSASNRWVVQASAPRAGFDPSNVIAMQVEVEGGTLTDRPVRPLICHGGKVEAIHQRFGRRADLAFGDSLGDLEMLSDAAHPFVIGRHDKPGAALLEVARDKGWPVHLF
jgi:HAD superfamily phosphoserine phosphatase-like hydrolase